MKIGLICDWYLPRVGGVEYQLRDLACELRACGHDARIVTATAGAEEADGAPVHRLGLRVLPGWGVAWEPAMCRLILDFLEQERFDVLHANGLYCPLGLIAAWAARRLGVPCVLSNHSMLGRAGVWQFRLLDRACGWSRWADALTAVSRASARETSAASRRDVTVLPNGIDPARWRRLELIGGDEPERTVISVLRFTARKRPVSLVRVAARACAALPASRRPRFLLIGDGPERARAQREATRLGMGDRIHLPGRLPRAELLQLLSRASIFALPTVREAFGIAVLEARCCGLPVVARAGSGVDDLIEHGRHGLLARDDGEMARHLALLLQDEPRRAAMATAAREGVEAFAWPRMAQAHLRLYDQLVDATRRRGAAATPTAAAGG